MRLAFLGGVERRKRREPLSGARPHADRGAQVSQWPAAPRAGGAGGACSSVPCPWGRPVVWWQSSWQPERERGVSVPWLKDPWGPTRADGVRLHGWSEPRRTRKMRGCLSHREKEHLGRRSGFPRQRRKSAETKNENTCVSISGGC